MPPKKRIVQARHRARELAVQLLYSLEIRPDQNIAECLDAFIRWGFASIAGVGEISDWTVLEMNWWGFVPNSGIDDDVKNYVFFLVSEVWRVRLAIDDIMRRIVTGWRLERMVAVDRAVLRIAIFEGFLKKEVPVAVAISEAVELARTFGTEDSGKFVNGVLAKVLRFMEAENRDSDKKNPGTGNDKTRAISTTKDSADS